MKKIIPLFLMLLLVALSSNANETASNDTTIIFNKKTITVADGNGQIKVTVSEIQTDTSSTPCKQLYEGIYSDEKSYEKWTVMEEIGIQIPFISNNKARHNHHKYDMKAHWAGLGWGFANIADADLNMTDIDGLAIKANESSEFFLNISEKILPIYRNNIGLTTGFGISWRKYRLDYNTHLVDLNGYTGVYDAPVGIKYDYSRLKVVYLNFPLLLEFQPSFGGNHKAFLSAGIVGGVNIYSSFKVKYKNSNGHTTRNVEDRGLNTSPLTLDYMAQAGYDNVSIYAKYSPFTIFQANKGPKVQAVSLGVLLGF